MPVYSGKFSAKRLTSAPAAVVQLDRRGEPRARQRRLAPDAGTRCRCAAAAAASRRSATSSGRIGIAVDLALRLGHPVLQRLHVILRLDGVARDDQAAHRRFGKEVRRRIEQQRREHEAPRRARGSAPRPWRGGTTTTQRAGRPAPPPRTRPPTAARRRRDGPAARLRQDKRRPRGEHPQRDEPRRGPAVAGGSRQRASAAIRTSVADPERGDVRRQDADEDRQARARSTDAARSAAGRSSTGSTPRREQQHEQRGAAGHRRAGDQLHERRTERPRRAGARRTARDAARSRTSGPATSAATAAARAAAERAAGAGGPGIRPRCQVRRQNSAAEPAAPAAPARRPWSARRRGAHAPTPGDRAAGR